MFDLHNTVYTQHRLLTQPYINELPMSCYSGVYVTPDRDDLVDRELGQIPPQEFPPLRRFCLPPAPWMFVNMHLM